MKLKWFHVRDFQSVRDSGRIDVHDMICLVGKNEAGKSALLKALYRLNPVVEGEGSFSVTHDFPRMHVEDYRIDVERKVREPAIPIQACYLLDHEADAIERDFGSSALLSREYILSKDYSNRRTFALSVNEPDALRFLILQADLTEQVREQLASVVHNPKSILQILVNEEQTAAVKTLVEVLSEIDKKGIRIFLDRKYIAESEPEYMYFDEYYQLTGHENLEALAHRESAKELKPSDHPMLGLIRLARLQLNELLKMGSTVELRNRLEGASNHLTAQVLRYWSQNKHLRMSFDVRPALPNDPPGMQSGTNIWGGVHDSRHGVTTELGSRSRGFVWFFSFLAWYSDVKRDERSLILLLDEPGLTLHARAQYDLLRYFETELKGRHQLVYSTHSPFMIDPAHFDRVRIVQDAGIDYPDDEGSDEGSRVLTDVFAATEDSLFPLQAALGYELHQTLFVGPYSLVVEGPADLLYIQTMSTVLEEEGRLFLDPRWTITPVGGAAKVPTFVALLGRQKGMTIATLLDTQLAERKNIEDLYKERLLKKSNVFTYADFTSATEADVEDLFGQAFYVELVNREYERQLTQPIQVGKLNGNIPRVVVQLERLFESEPLRSGQYTHFRPARYFSENARNLNISDEIKNRFETIYKAINGLLP